LGDDELLLRVLPSKQMVVWKNTQLPPTSSFAKFRRQTVKLFGRFGSEGNEAISRPIAHRIAWISSGILRDSMEVGAKIP